MATLVPTRETLGDVETFKALISGTLSGSFVEPEAIRLGPQGLSHNPLTEVIIPNVAEFAGSVNNLDIQTLEVSAKLTVSNGLIRNCEKLDSIILRRSSSGVSLGQESVRGTPISAGEGGIYTDAGYVDGWESRINGTATNRRLDWMYVNVYPIERYPVEDHSSIPDTWADIMAAVNGGTYADRYHIGDVKRLDLLNGDHAYMQLVGIDLDPLASDPNQKAALSWILRGVCRYEKQMHNSTSTSITWGDSDLRAWLNEELLEEFPNILRRNIKAVRKISRSDFHTYVYTDTVMSGETSVSNDKIWIPSYYEMNSYSNWRNGSPLFSTGITYYSPNNPGTYSYGGIYWDDFAYRFDTDYWGARYWFRDKLEGTNATFATAPYRAKSGEDSYSSYGVSSYYATSTNPVVFGFCI